MMNSVQHQQLRLPPHIPVMFLPETVLLPHVLLPLYIFEPRYRAMLAHCLEEHRMFSVAMMKPGVSEVRGAGDFYETAGVGLVRACVGHEDGTSHLVLQGLARVQLGGFVQETPFRIAEVMPLASHGTDDPILPMLCDQMRQLAAAMLPPGNPEREKLHEQLAEIDDAGVLSDVVAHTFLRGADRQQEVLEELQVSARVRRVLHLLEREAAA
jgi:Lon protease-like protein